MQTPLVYGGLLYNCRDNGVLSVYDAKTGERKYQQRLAEGKTGFTASPVAADGKIYFTSEDGDIYVVKAGPTFRAAVEEHDGRGLHGDAGDLARRAVLPDARPPGGDRIGARSACGLAGAPRALRSAGGARFARGGRRILHPSTGRRAICRRLC